MEIKFTNIMDVVITADKKIILLTVGKYLDTMRNDRFEKEETRCNSIHKLLRGWN